MYNFKEKQLSDAFCSAKVKAIKQLLQPTGVITIVGMPGVGISLFARFLATRKDQRAIYIDMLSLSTLTRHALYHALLHELGGTSESTDEEILLTLYKKQISTLKESVTIIFNRFDALKKEINQMFLSNLRTLRHGAADKVSLIFITHTSFIDLIPEAIEGPNLDMFSNTFFFTPYDKNDLQELQNLYTPKNNVKNKTFDTAYALSGGHYQLFQLILKSQQQKYLLADKYILSSLKNIYDNLSYPQRKQLHRIVFKKSVTRVDEDVLNTGIIAKNDNQYVIFSPLFAEYIINRTSMKLPLKEATLFRLMKKRIGQIITKDELFTTLWQDTQKEEGSDWALNALIYRLRKNAVFSASGYIIESHKKLGYSLIKI